MVAQGKTYGKKKGRDLASIFLDLSISPSKPGTYIYIYIYIYIFIYIKGGRDLIYSSIAFHFERKKEATTSLLAWADDDK